MHPDSLPMRPRLVATLVLIPVVLVVWYVALNWLLSFMFAPPVTTPTRGSSLNWIGFALVYSGPFPWYYFAVLAIWWRTVRWTGARRVWVAVISLIVLVAAVVSGTLGAVGVAPLLQIATNSLLVPAALFALSVVCYPRGDELPTGGVACPRCGYDLRGQRECRCPECGQQFALGELTWSATRAPSAQAPSPGGAATAGKGNVGSAERSERD
jgi:hypothetical protein